MAKLNSPISNIEKTTNKVTSTVTPPASWTDQQYPSADSVYIMYNLLKQDINNTHPVGSVVCMSSNTNPSSTLGGTWELIDKEFRQTWIDCVSSDWEAGNATFSSAVIALYGKTGMIRVSCIPSATFGDQNPTKMGKLKWSNYGLGSTYFSCSYRSAQGDGAQASVVYTLDTDGTINCYDALHLSGEHKVDIASTYDIVFTDYVTWEKENMPDKYCDKFYFKRTA